MDIVKIFEDNGLYMGRMVSYSKSDYSSKYPKNKVIFNANVITTSGKVWYGDLDATVSEDALKKISIEIGEPLFILYEMDARFGSEERDITNLVKDAMFVVDENGVKLGMKGEQYKKYYE